MRFHYQQAVPARYTRAGNARWLCRAAACAAQNVVDTGESKLWAAHGQTQVKSPAVEIATPDTSEAGT
ncbi:hypothetical protein PC116_g28894 [Phytophthora cactorum]|nr:hypothetical protein PC116_g28894 [Phytophthora cactorum]